MGRMIQSFDAFPVNLGISGKGNAARPGGAGRDDQGRRLRAEAARGLGHHAGGDRQLPQGRRCYDVQVMLHSDTLNESGFVEAR